MARRSSSMCRRVPLTGGKTRQAGSLARVRRVVVVALAAFACAVPAAHAETILRTPQAFDAPPPGFRLSAQQAVQRAVDLPAVAALPHGTRVQAQYDSNHNWVISFGSRAEVDIDGR